MWHTISRAIDSTAKTLRLIVIIAALAAAAVILSQYVADHPPLRPRPGQPGPQRRLRRRRLPRLAGREVVELTHHVTRDRSWNWRGRRRVCLAGLSELSGLSDEAPAAGTGKVTGSARYLALRTASGVPGHHGGGRPLT
jgi:hypothetical protein